MSNRIYLTDIYYEAERDFLQPRPEAQLAVDLLVMACVYKVAESDAAHAFNSILRSGTKKLLSSYMMDQIGSSFCRVLSSRSSFQNLKLASLIRPFVTKFEVEDGHVPDAYWWKRLPHMISHSTTLRILEKLEQES